MPITTLGHVVLKVRSLERSIAFYRDVLGFLEIGATATPPDAQSVGLVHVAFRVDATLEDLRQFKRL